MRILLDTHIVIWLAYADPRIPFTLRNLVLQADTRYVSAVSAAEIAIKHRKFGKQFDFSLKSLAMAVSALACEELPLTAAHVAALAHLPRLHDDPFDHLLMSQAITERVPLLTLDAKIRQYEVPALMLL
jgi:PIN domain nuclease of toxin-antitoxin system